MNNYPPQGGYPGAYPPSGYPSTGAPNTPQYGLQAPSNSPYPPAPGASPYPPAPGSSPYPPAPGGSPYPPAPGSSPYPPAPGTNPYPPALGSSPYPPAPGGLPYPPMPGNPQYPPAASNPQYPPAPSNPQYPPAPNNPQYPSNPQYPQYPPAPGNPQYQQPSGNPQYQQNQGNYPQQSGAPGYPPAQGGMQTSSYSQSQSSAPPTSGYTSSLPYTEMPTVKPAALFDPSSDAAALRKAMKGFGTDEKAIINILARRTSFQRQEILQKYSQSYGKDLIKDLKSELSGRFEDVIIALMTPLPQFLAKECHDAIMGIGTNERTLVEVLCTRDNASVRQIKDAYQYLYKKPIQNDIKADTSGDFKRLMISICTAYREEGPCNPALAPGLAQQLYKAGEGKVGTNEGEFNRILATYSYELLRCVFDEYQKIKGKSFGDALDAELSGDLKLGMKAIYMAIQNRASFFAKEIRDSMKGMGTKDKALIRLIVSRCEIDMVNIKQEYQKMFHKPLEKDIEGDVSGDFKTVLLKLVEN